MEQINIFDLVARLQDILGLDPNKIKASPYNCYSDMAKQLAYACEFQAETMLDAIPDYEIPEAARKYIIELVLKEEHGSEWPKELLEAKAQLLIEQATSAQVRDSAIEMSNTEDVCISDTITDDEVVYDADKLVLPRLPRVFEIMSRYVPEGFEPALVCGMLPIMGTLATGIRFRYRTTAEIHSLSFISCIMAPFGGGKSSIINAADVLLTPIDEFEEESGLVRRVGESMSRSKFLLLMHIADGQHLVSTLNEIDSLVNNNRRGPWANMSDIMRMSFDNSVFRQQLLDRKAFSGSVAIYYNLLAAGTPAACMRFFGTDSSENGLVSRVCYSILPDTSGQPLPTVGQYTDEDRGAVINTARMLMSCQGVIECPIVDATIEQWEQKKCEEYATTGRQSIDQLRRRSAVIGYRAGMLCYLLEKDNPSFTNEDIANFTTYIANYVFCMQIRLFGKAIDAAAEKDRAILNGNGVSSAVKIRTLLIEKMNLPALFTRAEFDAAYTAVHGGNGKSARKCFSRNLTHGKIKEADKEGYYEIVA